MSKVIILLALFLLVLPQKGFTQTDSINITGTWIFEVDLGHDGGSPVFIIKQAGDDLSGTYKGRLGEAKLTGSREGDKFRFTFDTDLLANISYKGTVKGEELEGTCNFPAYGSGTFIAKRKKENK